MRDTQGHRHYYLNVERGRANTFRLFLLFGDNRLGRDRRALMLQANVQNKKKKKSAYLRTRNLCIPLVKFYKFPQIQRLTLDFGTFLWRLVVQVAQQGIALLWVAFWVSLWTRSQREPFVRQTFCFAAREKKVAKIQ